MKKWIVGAFIKEKHVYDASIPYDSFSAAAAYCAKCIKECSTTTGKTYKVYSKDIEK